MIGLVKKMLICESCDKKRKLNLRTTVSRKKKGRQQQQQQQNMLQFCIATIIAIYRSLHPTDRFLRSVHTKCVFKSMRFRYP